MNQVQNIPCESAKTIKAPNRYHVADARLVGRAEQAIQQGSGDRVDAVLTVPTRHRVRCLLLRCFVLLVCDLSVSGSRPERGRATRLGSSRPVSLRYSAGTASGSRSANVVSRASATNMAATRNIPLNPIKGRSIDPIAAPRPIEPLNRAT